MIEMAADTVAVSARRTAGKYRGYIDFEDISQELMLWVLSNQEKVKGWLDVEDKTDRKRGEAALALTLNRIGDQYARSEKAQSLGYETVDEHFYDKGQVEMFLPFVLSGEWTNPPIPEGQRVGGGGALSETGGWMATCGDIELSLRSLPVDSYRALTLRYVDQAEWRDIAEEFDCSVTTATRRVERALERLVDTLGGKSPWNSRDRKYRRQVMSNAQALAALEDL